MTFRDFSSFRAIFPLLANNWSRKWPKTGQKLAKNREEKVIKKPEK